MIKEAIGKVYCPMVRYVASGIVDGMNEKHPKEEREKLLTCAAGVGFASLNHVKDFLGLVDVGNGTSDERPTRKQINANLKAACVRAGYTFNPLSFSSDCLCGRIGGDAKDKYMAQAVGIALEAERLGLDVDVRDPEDAYSHKSEDSQRRSDEIDKEIAERKAKMGLKPVSTKESFALLRRCIKEEGLINTIRILKGSKKVDIDKSVIS